MASDNDLPETKSNDQDTKLDLAKIIAQYQLQQQSTISARQHRCRETKAQNASCAMSEDSETSDTFDRKPSAVESPKEMVVAGPISSKKPVPSPFNHFERNNCNHENWHADSQCDKPYEQMKTKKQRKHPPRTSKKNNDPSNAAVSLSSQQIGKFQGSEVRKESASLRESSKMKAKIDQIPKPKRPLSAYNIFFRDHRLKLLQQQQANANHSLTPNKRKKAKDRFANEGNKKIGFSHLAKSVSVQWSTIDPQLRIHYENQAQLDLERYTKEMEVYKEAKMKVLSEARLQLEMTVDSDTLRQRFHLITFASHELTE